MRTARLGVKPINTRYAFLLNYTGGLERQFYLDQILTTPMICTQGHRM
ncbi:9350_t:CDS:2 [Dentiscutata erythropus]|uniref:9350_t:CDS:1 n=1 Tax=Dentiscutata erythropus TaxID=1348616 RepID=A0A9N9EFI2_9GLOM|nr:9350_t:CDS:2 [Dentiscutata erythropus]